MKPQSAAVHPLFIKDAVYSKAQIDEILGINPRRWAKWKKAGLKPLNTGTNAEYFLSNDLFEVWTKPVGAPSRGR